MICRSGYNCHYKHNLLIPGFVFIIVLDHRWQQLVTMEVILSAAFGVKSEAQLDPDDKMMSHARRAMTPRPFASLASLIPIVGKKLFKKLILSSWGLNWMHIIEFAQLVIKGRKEDVANSRNVSICHLCNPTDILILSTIAFFKVRKSISLVRKR